MHPEWLIGLFVLLVAVLPWIAAIVWIASRAGWASLVLAGGGSIPVPGQPTPGVRRRAK